MRKLRTEQKDRQQENSRPRDERNGGGADIAGTCDKADAAGEKGKTNEVDAEELKKAGFADASVEKYLALFDGVAKAEDGIAYLAGELAGFLEEEVVKSMQEIAASVTSTKTADFELEFDPTGTGYVLLYRNNF